jgi:hypothetical protein
MFSYFNSAKKFVYRLFKCSPSKEDLISACISNDLETLRGYYLTPQDARTGLITSVVAGRYDCCEFFVDAGSDNLNDAFNLAEKAMNLRMCRLFIEFGCKKVNEFLLLACEMNDNSAVEIALSCRPTNLDEALVIACRKNSLSISEMLIQSGANVTVGLRNSKSPNITKMLYRYEQNSELIN